MIETIIHTLKNIKIIFLAVLFIKLFVLMINLIRKVVLYRGKNEAYRFIEAIVKEMNYCQKIIKKHFNKNLVMSAVDEERFQLSNNCWICDKLFDAGDGTVRGNCHITGKYRGSAHQSCNMNLY